jgi:hypothetical protein
MNAQPGNEFTKGLPFGVGVGEENPGEQGSGVRALLGHLTLFNF